MSHLVYLLYIHVYMPHLVYTLYIHVYMPHLVYALQNVAHARQVVQPLHDATLVIEGHHAVRPDSEVAPPALRIPVMRNFIQLQNFVKHIYLSSASCSLRP